MINPKQPQGTFKALQSFYELKEAVSVQEEEEPLVERPNLATLQQAALGIPVQPKIKNMSALMEDFDLSPLEQLQEVREEVAELLQKIDRSIKRFGRG